MPSFNFTSQRPIALTTEGLQVEFTEGVDIAVPIAATQVSVAPIPGITGTNAQAALAEIVVATPIVLGDLNDVVVPSGTTPVGKFLSTTAPGAWGAVDLPASEPEGAVATHAAGINVHTISGVAGLQTALDGKSPTGHNHGGVYEPLGAVSDHVIGTNVHTIAGVNGLQAALADLQTNALMKNPAPGVVQNVNGLITLRSYYPQLGFATLTLNVATTGVANPADPIGDGVGSGQPFNLLSSALTWVAGRVKAQLLNIKIAAGTYTDPGTINFYGGCNIEGISSAATILSFTDIPVFSAGDYNIAKCTINATALRFSMGALFGITCPDLVLNGGLQLRRGSYFVCNASSITINPIAGASIEIAGELFRPSGQVVIPNVATYPVQMANLACFALLGNIPPANVVYPGLAIVASTGYSIEPATGIIRQWGMTAPGATGEVTVTLPIAFPNAFFNVVVTVRGSAVVGTAERLVRTHSPTLTNFIIVTTDAALTSQPAALYWQAIGH